MTKDEIAKLGYYLIRQLPTGEWAALRSFIFTTGLIVGIDDVGYRTRFCYERREDAAFGVLSWDGTGDPPGPWIKEKGRNGDRDNPATFAGIPINLEIVDPNR